MPFKKDNQLGKLGKGISKNPELAELNKAIATVEKEKDVSLLKHFIERALKSDTVLVALMKKKIADMTKSEVSQTLENYKEILAESIRLRESINATNKK